MPLLEVDQIQLSFAGIRALQGVSLSVERGEICAVIGPNGAGKTSLFNCISGLYRPQEGKITFSPEGAAPVDLTKTPAHDIAPLGVARMFQNLALFEHLTVLENLLVGCHHRFASRWWHDLWWWGKARVEEVRHRHKVEEVIDFLDLERYRPYPVGILPYGVRKRVELGRALCTEPSLILLDEPAAGLNQEETEDLARYVLDIKEELHITQILIEHELRFVLDLADRIAVLDFGQKIAEGTPDAIRNDPHVRDAYIGRDSAAAAALDDESETSDEASGETKASDGASSETETSDEAEASAPAAEADGATDQETRRGGEDDDA